jgi:hypothetical protein
MALTVVNEGGIPRGSEKAKIKADELQTRRYVAALYDCM